MKRKSLNWLGIQASVQSPLEKLIFDKNSQTYAKSDIEVSWSCPIFLDFLDFCWFTFCQIFFSPIIDLNIF